MGIRLRPIGGGGGGGGVTNVSVKPKGSTRAIGSVETEVGSFKEIASYTPAVGKTFSLSKILATWESEDEQDIVVKVGGETVGEYFSTDYVMDWFPPGIDLVGDGTSKVAIEAEAVSTPAAPLIGFIEGELT